VLEQGRRGVLFEQPAASSGLSSNKQSFTQSNTRYTTTH
jgi:hypothetical protein